MKQDSGAVALETVEASGGGFDGLNTAIDSFTDRIGDVVITPIEQAFDVFFEHPGHLFDRLQTRTDRPTIPVLVKIFLRLVTAQMWFPKPAEILLYRPGPRRF